MVMSDPQLYAYRVGASKPRYDLGTFSRLLLAYFHELEDGGWLQSTLGKDCTDARVDVGARVLAEFGRDVWPLSVRLEAQDEMWLFTGIEFYARHVAEPVASWIHEWNLCGIHVTQADRIRGALAFRERVNQILANYERPFCLADDGLIYEQGPDGLSELVPLPSGDSRVDARVASAVRAFKRYGAAIDAKRHAVRDLADILELLRDTGSTDLPSKDERYLFDIANNFGIRHLNKKQRLDYDHDVFLEWIFYAFLAAIRLATRLQTTDPPGLSD